MNIFIKLIIFLLLEKKMLYYNVINDNSFEADILCSPELQ